MEGKNKNLVFIVVIMMSFLLLLLSLTVEASKEKASAPKEASTPKEKVGASKEKAGAPAPKEKEKEKGSGTKEKAGAPKEAEAHAPSGGGGGGEGGDKMECVKFAVKITHSKENIHPAAKEACGRTQNSQTCERTVMEMNLQESKDINPKNVIILQTKAMQEELALATKDCEAKTKDKLYKTCAGSYKKGMDEMASVTDATNMADINTRITLILGVMKHVQTCQSQVEKEKPDSPLREVNEFLLKSGENIVALATAVSAGAIKLERK